MNLLYERLIDAFVSKAKIDRDAHQIAQTLKHAYPECTLPVEKTIKRFLSGETHNPRDTFLGFWAAYILGETAENVLKADRNNTVGAFYEIYLQKNPIGDPSVQNEKIAFFMFEKHKKTTILLWFLALLTLSLIGYIAFLKKTHTQSSSIESPLMNNIKSDTFTMRNTKEQDKKNDHRLD
jgi:hypothetical protein